MKVKVFDTSLEGRGHAIGSFTLEGLMNDWLSEHNNVDIKSVHMQECLDGQLMVLVMYEEKRDRHFQQKSFYTRTGGKEINQFLASHDVVKVDHTSADHGEIITTIVYRKVIKKVDPWGTKQDEED